MLLLATLHDSCRLNGRGEGGLEYGVLHALTPCMNESTVSTITHNVTVYDYKAVWIYI